MDLNRQILRKITLGAGVIFLLILGFFLFLHYIRGKKDILDFKISKSYINLSKIDYKFFKKGVLAYEIFSKRLNYKSKNKNIIMLEDVRAYIYGKDKKPEYVITGKTGRLNSASKNIAISGGVIIKYIKGTTMKSDAIDYIAKDGRIIAPGSVEIKGRNYFISGTGLTFYINKSLFILQNNVHFISDNTDEVTK